MKTFRSYVGHLISRTPERYHGHEFLVAIGLVLTVVGILLISGYR